LSFLTAESIEQKMNMSTADNEVQWLFLDLNAFFASCGQQENPAPRGKPVMAVQTLTDSARVDQLWQRVLRSKPPSVGSCCLTWLPPASISRTSSHLTTNGA
jgi:hypothetical protein